MLVYAVTIFLSAFLLFEVQPMIGKIILPWFGGAAAVWSTCLLFFQAALLAGYLYAHCSTRYLKPRHQAILHIGLMAVSLALLPIIPSPTWKPVQAGDPSTRILLLLTATIGLPYVLLSTTSPLLQAWYVAAKPGAIPYRLFALSNLGSLLALFSFPVLVEPLLATRTQAVSWSGVYAVFVVLCAVVAWTTLRAAAWKVEQGKVEPVPLAEATLSNPATSEPPAPNWLLHVLWAALAACASALLLAITNHLSQNVAPIPFLWVLTLGVYLLSFIICFEREKLYYRPVFLPLLAVAVGAASFAIYYDEGNPNLKWSIPVFVGTLFICCMVCHGELVRLKPDPRHLTNFYLMVSVGGAVGGLFVAVAAPHIFHSYAELPLAMIACPALVAIVLWIAPGWSSARGAQIVRVAMIVFTVALAGYLAYQKRREDQRYLLSVRNYYGVLRVYDSPDADEHTPARKLIHGTINHGSQLLDAKARDTATSYYGPKSGMGRAIRYFESKGPVRVGSIGLGAGVTLSYCRPGDFFRIYEINPLDFQIATSWFTFFNDCHGDHQVLMGDARLTMERQAPQNYDVIAVDAFTSDAIPVHLLTRECFEFYFRQLQPGGILAVHVSNRFLNLVPVVARNAHDFGKTAVTVDDDGEDEDYMSSSDWVLVSGDPEVFNRNFFKAHGIETVQLRPSLRPWTDDYSNLFQILK
jgi:MFS family permease